MTAVPAASTSTSPPAVERRPPEPITLGTRPTGNDVVVKVFVVVPFLALLATLPFAWGWGLTALDAALAAGFYLVTLTGITVGYHRHFTHRSFKAVRPVRIILAVLGSMALQGPLITWVADHRRHHAFSDVEGDPHSPWRYGTSVRGLTKGLFYSHLGWLFHRELSNRARFAPDLEADPAIQRVDRLFPMLVAVSMLTPAALGGLITWSWQGALTAFFWAGLVRVGLLHHVTWSINSVCHVFGDRPFAVRDGDKAANFWPLAVLSFGESWHNLHHAEPTSARHGALRGQVDPTARVIWVLEKLGWVYDVRWPKPERLAAKLIAAG
jgi:stearoyl-CoA desaturase (delta-9 desaturase)